MNARELIEILDLKPLPEEGGFYRETYRSRETVAADALPERYRSGRCISTAIYYLLTPDTFSAFHRISTDEVFHFYLGDPVTMAQLLPDGRRLAVVLGQDICAGQVVQAVVPASVWQGMFLNDGGQFALLGTTVAPGFESEDFELGDRQTLIEQYPDHAKPTAVWLRLPARNAVE